QPRQQPRVVHVSAVRRAAVAARAGVHPEALNIRADEARQSKIVEMDEAAQELPRRVQLQRHAALGEIDLHAVRAAAQAAPDLGLVLADEVGDELLARIARELLARIHEAQRRGGYYRLFDGHLGMTQCFLEEAV